MEEDQAVGPRELLRLLKGTKKGITSRHLPAFRKYRELTLEEKMWALKKGNTDDAIFLFQEDGSVFHNPSNMPSGSGLGAEQLLRGFFEPRPAAVWIDTKEVQDPSDIEEMWRYYPYGDKDEFMETFSTYARADESVEKYVYDYFDRTDNPSVLYSKSNKLKNFTLSTDPGAKATTIFYTPPLKANTVRLPLPEGPVSVFGAPFDEPEAVVNGKKAGWFAWIYESIKGVFVQRDIMRFLSTDVGERSKGYTFHYMWKMFNNVFSANVGHAQTRAIRRGLPESVMLPSYPTMFRYHYMMEAHESVRRIGGSFDEYRQRILYNEVKAFERYSSMGKLDLGGHYMDERLGALDRWFGEKLAGLWKRRDAVDDDLSEDEEEGEVDPSAAKMWWEVPDALLWMFADDNIPRTDRWIFRRETPILSRIGANPAEKRRRRALRKTFRQWRALGRIGYIAIVSANQFDVRTIRTVLPFLAGAQSEGVDNLIRKTVSTEEGGPQVQRDIRKLAEGAAETGDRGFMQSFVEGGFRGAGEHLYGKVKKSVTDLTVGVANWGRRGAASLYDTVGRSVSDLAKSAWRKGQQVRRFYEDASVPYEEVLRRRREEEIREYEESERKRLAELEETWDEKWDALEEMERRWKEMGMVDINLTNFEKDRDFMAEWREDPIRTEREMVAFKEDIEEIFTPDQYMARKRRDRELAQSDPQKYGEEVLGRRMLSLKENMPTVYDKFVREERRLARKPEMLGAARKQWILDALAIYDTDEYERRLSLEGISSMIGARRLRRPPEGLPPHKRYEWYLLKLAHLTAGLQYLPGRELPLQYRRDFADVYYMLFKHAPSLQKYTNLFATNEQNKIGLQFLNKNIGVFHDEDLADSRKIAKMITNISRMGNAASNYDLAQQSILRDMLYTRAKSAELRESEGSSTSQVGSAIGKCGRRKRRRTTRAMIGEILRPLRFVIWSVDAESLKRGLVREIGAKRYISNARLGQILVAVVKNLRRDPDHYAAGAIGVRKNRRRRGFRRRRRFARSSDVVLKRPLKGGYGDKMGIDQVDAKQLVSGMLVELEHNYNDVGKSTTDKLGEALDVAMDHLAENPEYYTVPKVTDERLVMKYGNSATAVPKFVRRTESMPMPVRHFIGPRIAEEDSEDDSDYDEEEEGEELDYEPDVLGGKYVVDWTKKIGGGGFSKVYSAHLVGDSQEKFAVKKINPVHSSREMVDKEIGILQQLGGHPNVTTLYDHYFIGETAYLVMDLFDRDMDFYMKSTDTTIPFENSRNMIRQILTGIEHVHGNDICHRDLRPVNVFVKYLSEERESGPMLVAVGDFGQSTREGKMCEDEYWVETVLLIAALVIRQTASEVPTNLLETLWALTETDEDDVLAETMKLGICVGGAGFIADMLPLLWDPDFATATGYLGHPYLDSSIGTAIGWRYQVMLAGATDDDEGPCIFADTEDELRRKIRAAKHRAIRARTKKTSPPSKSLRRRKALAAMKRKERKVGAYVVNHQWEYTIATRDLPWQEVNGPFYILGTAQAFMTRLSMYVSDYDQGVLGGGFPRVQDAGNTIYVSGSGISNHVISLGRIEIEPKLRLLATKIPPTIPAEPPTLDAQIGNPIRDRRGRSNTLKISSDGMLSVRKVVKSLDTIKVLPEHMDDVLKTLSVYSADDGEPYSRVTFTSYQHVGDSGIKFDIDGVDEDSPDVGMFVVEYSRRTNAWKTVYDLSLLTDVYPIKTGIDYDAEISAMAIITNDGLEDWIDSDMELTAFAPFRAHADLYRSSGRNVRMPPRMARKSLSAVHYEMEEEAAYAAPSADVYGPSADARLVSDAVRSFKLGKISLPKGRGEKVILKTFGATVSKWVCYDSTVDSDRGRLAMAVVPSDVSFVVPGVIRLRTRGGDELGEAAIVVLRKGERNFVPYARADLTEVHTTKTKKPSRVDMDATVEIVGKTVHVDMIYEYLTEYQMRNYGARSPVSYRIRHRALPNGEDVDSPVSVRRGSLERVDVKGRTMEIFAVSPNKAFMVNVAERVRERRVYDMASSADFDFVMSTKVVLDRISGGARTVEKLRKAASAQLRN